MHYHHMMSFPAVFWIAVLVVVGLMVVSTRRRNRQVEKQRRQEIEAALATSKAAASEDVTKFGEELQELDADVAGNPLDEAMRRDYEQALDAYDHAKQSLDAVKSPEEIKNVTQILEDGRYSIACVKARVVGAPLPQKLPPCFFDPAHGPSVRNVDWAPAGGAVRSVPACQIDADRIEQGASPYIRTVMVGSQRVPYWEGGQAYAPWAQGYYSSWSGSDLIRDVMVTSLIFNSMSMVPWMLGGAISGLGELGEGISDGIGDIGEGIGDFFGDLFGG